MLDKASRITGAASIGNLVQGNFIGTDASGTQALGNGSDGILVSSQGLGGSASQTTIRGNLISGNAVNGIEILGGGNNLVAGNLIGTDITGTKDLGNAHDGVVIDDTTDTGVVVATTGHNTVGGTTETDRNVISGNDANGLVIVGATEVGNLVLGNDIGTNIHGQMDPGVDLGNLGDGVLITRPNAGGLTASSNSIGGTTAEERNVISGNHVDGVAIAGDSGPIGNVVQGNYIGTDSTGTVALGNGRSGVRISSAIGSTDSASHNTIGGTAAGAGNLISGNKEDGVAIRGDVTGGTDNMVQGNLIGTDTTGKKDLGNLGNGVKIDLSASKNSIGGTAVGAGNTIAFNGANGVLISSGTGNGILGNSIFSNVKLGSDLGDDGETLNDKTDADSGANNLQNAPDLLSVTTDGIASTTTVVFLLDSNPSTNFRIEFFFNRAKDASGADDFSSLGEGGQFIDFANATTAPVGGNQPTYTYVLNSVLPAGEFVTATATDPNNNTSEFTHDADLDGLLDSWETTGIDANHDGTIDLTLPGANPLHKDLYVEVDAMKGRAPTQATLDGVVTVFANAPNIYNPDERSASILSRRSMTSKSLSWTFRMTGQNLMRSRQTTSELPRSDWIPIPSRQNAWRTAMACLPTPTIAAVRLVLLNSPEMTSWSRWAACRRLLPEVGFSRGRTGCSTPRTTSPERPRSRPERSCTSWDTLSACVTEALMTSSTNRIITAS